MKTLGKFILMDRDEFQKWLNIQKVSRKITLVQQHHTYIPGYAHFTGDNHFKLCQSMERSHKERGFAEIGQNFTTFPDGKIMVCRSLKTTPACMKGANTNGICIEHLGYFDTGKDKMSDEHRETILFITTTLLKKLGLKPNDKSVVYHHWYDLNTGLRVDEGKGSTKSCPGTAFFGGNTIKAFNANFLPLLETYSVTV